jgi:hypothetical protein
MKRFFLIIMPIMVFVFSRAQVYHPLVDTNKLWSTAHQYSSGLTLSSDFTKFQGEETLQGHIYKKVWTTTDTSLANWNPNGYIREDTDKRVFIRSWSGGPDDLRYDFGADAGDTIYLFYDTFSLLTGEERKRINLSCYSVGSFVGNDTWVEGMGSLYGVLQSGSCALLGDMPQMICFEENDTLKYFNNNFEECFIITGIRSPEYGSGSINFFPNPSDGIITVKVNDPLILPLTIVFYDLTGNKILEKKIQGTLTFIDLFGFTSTAVVFYQITGSKGSYSSGKIIVKKK